MVVEHLGISREGHKKESNHTMAATTEPPKPSTIRRKRRWGDGPEGDDIIGGSSSSSSSSDVVADSSVGGRSPLTPSTNNNGPIVLPPSSTNNSVVSDPKARAAALQASIKARLDALKARTITTTMAPTPPPSAMTASAVAKTTTTTTTGDESRKRTRTNNEEYTAEGRSIIDESGDNNKTKKRAKVFELDMSTTTSGRILEKQMREEKLRASAAAVSKEKVNPYLAHVGAASGAKMKSTLEEGAGVDSSTASLSDIVDDRLANKPERARSRPLNFIVPGTYVALGEKKRQLAANAEESGFISGRKTGNVFKSVGMGGGVTTTLDDDGDVPSSADIYGASMAGKIIDSGLPGRFDAPEIEPDERIAINEGNDVSIMLALNVATSSMPYAMEWWDAELLPGKLRKELAGEEGKAISSRAKKKRLLLGKAAKVDNGDDDDGQTTVDNTSNPDGYRTRIDKHDELIAKCYKQASLTHSKTHALLQHPVPVLTPAQQAAVEAKKNRPPTLHLTKAEQKRHRKLRRAERLREQQDMQAAGLVPPPEPRLTLANYMKVLGDQAILDPSRMEAAVVSQIQGRKLKHDQMNAERKLTKEQKAAKHARKLEEDTTQSIHVALFYVKDMGHPYHRTKVDLNAQQNGISGGVLECESLGMALIIAEGGERAIKRYIRLMTVRMRWKGEDFYEDEDVEEEAEDDLMVGDDEDEDVKGVDEDGNTIKTTKVGEKKRKKFNPDNECDLIWSGMAVKRAFHSFMFQNTESSVVARKILEAKGVAHYWDLAIGHVERKGGTGTTVGGLGLRFGDFGGS